MFIFSNFYLPFFAMFVSRSYYSKRGRDYT